MTPENASVLLEQLANGIHPLTGELLGEDQPTSHPEVIRALFMGAMELTNARPAKATPGAATNPPAKTPPQQAGKPWSAEEDEALTLSYTAGCTVADLALAHQRTKGAITSRLMRLGLLAPDRSTDNPG